MRQALGKGFAVGGPLGGMMDITRGAVPGGSWKFHRDSDGEVEPNPGKRVYPPPDGKLTFDKLSSVFLSGNRSRDDQPNHIRIQENVPREVAEAWVAMCPAAVYEIGRDDGGPTVQIKMAPSNCVQCGAITAKGGRLTPPEGGSGPEYSLM
jgi:electron-transferring-flavoprotein dehydrogenase